MLKEFEANKKLTIKLNCDINSLEDENGLVALKKSFHSEYIPDRYQVRKDGKYFNEVNQKIDKRVRLFLTMERRAESC